MPATAGSSGSNGRWPHPPEKVWRALTEPEHLAAWFPSDIEGDREVGAKLRFVFRNGEGPPSDGEMLVYDPPTTLEFRWERGILRFDLRPEGEGCVLTFVDTFDELGKASRDGAGWHACLDVLADHLAGRATPRHQPRSTGRPSTPATWRRSVPRPPPSAPAGGRWVTPPE